MTTRKIAFFAAGVIVSACLWWATEKMLDRHIGPRVGLES